MNHRFAIIIPLVVLVNLTLSGRPAKNTLTQREMVVIAPTGTIKFNVVNFEKRRRINPSKYYYGYLQNKVHCLQGELQGKPLQGKYVEFDPKNHLRETGYFENGLKDGEWKRYDLNGNRIEIAHYRNGIRCGKQVVFDNGKPKSVEVYHKGKLKKNSSSHQMSASNSELPIRKRKMDSSRIKRWLSFFKGGKQPEEEAVTNSEQQNHTTYQ